jgi:hypothetical protein
MTADATSRLLQLASQAQALTDPAQLRALLAQGHPLYSQAYDDIRTHVRAQAASLTDEQLATRCTQAGVPWEPGTSREDALTDLVHAVFDSTPACIAYTALAERAHQHHTGLID